MAWGYFRFLIKIWNYSFLRNEGGTNDGISRIFVFRKTNEEQIPVRMLPLAGVGAALEGKFACKLIKPGGTNKGVGTPSTMCFTLFME